MRSTTVSAMAFEYGLKPAGIAVVFVLVALLWTFPLQHSIDHPFVFLFFGAIMGSAWFCGSISGMVAVVLSSLLVTYFFIPPLYSISVATESQSFLAAFILFAITMSFVSSARKRAETQVKQARDLLETRVKQRTAELEQSMREISEASGSCGFSRRRSRSRYGGLMPAGRSNTSTSIFASTWDLPNRCC